MCVLKQVSQKQQYKKNQIKNKKYIDSIFTIDQCLANFSFCYRSVPLLFFVNSFNAVDFSNR